MSQSDELLMSLAATGSEHTHPVTDDDSYFRIDPYTRVISNVSGRKLILMQYDHKSERATFELPRYVEGHDMTLCNRVRVHFNNIEGSTGVEVPDVIELLDLGVNPDDPSTVICSWLIERHATQMVGILSFLIQYMCVSDDGTIDYEWHSDIYSDAEIKSGRNNGEAAVIQYTSLLEDWYQRIFGTGESVIEQINATAADRKAELNAESKLQQSAIEAKGQETIDSIPADYTETYRMAEEALRTKADAIAVEAEGNPIVINDSSDDHLLGLKIFGKTEQVTTTGKNLLPVSKSVNTLKGVSFTYNDDGTVTATGTPTEVFAASIYGAYATPIAFPVGEYIVSGGVDENRYIRVRVHTSDGTLKSQHYDCNESRTFTVEDGDLISASIYFATLDAVNGMKFSPMVRLATTADDTFEPYTGGMPSPSPSYPQELVSNENPVVTIDGNNLFDISKIAESNIITKNSDGTISILQYYSNTGIALSSLAPALVLGETYRILLDTDGAPYIYIVSYGIWSHNTTLTMTEDMLNGNVCIYGKTDQVDGSTQIRNIQIILDGASTEFESYKQGQTLATQRTLNAIGDVKDELVYDYQSNIWQHVQRVGEQTFDGTDASSWTYDPSALIFRRKVPGINETWNVTGNDGKSFMTHYRYDLGIWSSTAIDNGYIVNFNVLSIRHLGIDTVDALMELFASDPVTMQYILAEPIIHELTTEEVLAFKALHTNKTNTVIQNGVGAHMEAIYSADTLTFLRDHQPGPTDEQVLDALTEYVGEEGLESLRGNDGADGEDGVDGKDGYTPVKGVDYFGDDDKAELVEDVLQYIPKIQSIDFSTWAEDTWSVTLTDGTVFTHTNTRDSDGNLIEIDGIKITLPSEESQ